MVAGGVSPAGATKNSLVWTSYSVKVLFSNMKPTVKGPAVTWDSSAERGWACTKNVEQGAIVTVPRVEPEMGMDASRTELWEER